MTHTEPVNIYDIGDGVVLEADFSQDNLPVSPSAVTCLLRKPREDDPVALTAEHVGTVTNDAGEQVERYKAEYVTVVSGDHYFRFAGSGAVSAAGEQRFYVRPSKVLA